MGKLDEIGKLADMLSPATLGVPDLTRSLDLNPARWMYERIVRSINQFEGTLDADYEVGARLVSFGAEVVFHVDDVGFWGPDMIVFYGSDPNGRRVELLQHLSQLSVLLVAVPKVGPNPRRIGFEMVKRIESDGDQAE